MIVRLLFLILVLSQINESTISNQKICYFRCLADCFLFFNQNHNGSIISSGDCETQCEPYTQQNLCNDESCWSTCNNRMNPQQLLGSIGSVSVASNDSLTWNSVTGASIYVVSYKSSNQDNFEEDNVLVTQNTSIPRPFSSNIDFCSTLDVVITPFSKDGPGISSNLTTMIKPSPSADPKLELLEIRYLDKKYMGDFYESNGTVVVTFKYNTNAWPLGISDLQVTPLFHLISCIEPDLSQGIPVPEFIEGSINSTIVASIGADMMYRKCRFVYYLQSVASKKCGIIKEMHSPPSDALQTVQIQCDNVKNAPCFEEPVYDHPICGQVDNIKYEIETPNIDYNNELSNVTVNVTFIPLRRLNEKPTLYYVGLFGEASSYPSKEEETFLGVNITRYLGMTSSCKELMASGQCTGGENYNHTMLINNLHPRKMYGLTICAVKDLRNLTFPDVTSSVRSLKPKADKILIEKPTLAPTPSPPNPYTLLTHPTPDDFQILMLLSNSLEQFLSTDAPIESAIFAPMDGVKRRRETQLVPPPIMEMNSTDQDSHPFFNSSDYYYDEDANSSGIIFNNTLTYFISTSTNYDDYAKNLVGIIVGSIVGGTIIAILLLVILIYYLRNKHRKQEKLYKLKIAQIERDTQNRYIDFPAAIKHDIWEIERRNLIIHDDKKLGSGAFGTVYLGRLIGKSLAHKDANSPLGINLMRAENCEVAVKMLPEYADETSKSEFLKEIGLMKTLGYHERLVNMIACVTDSEPLCLVVEYCSDGDLLQYLRHRCKYMMKLDELGISYHDPPINENYDPNLIITIKQLLQFAVQISYGLEYLSQKGFVHRDVAARNVLVNDGNACKIGDFGLCRYIYTDQSQYKSKGGRLPLKWMSPEAIRNYEFSIKSDVWSFGILLFEIITLGGSPYPGMPPEDVLPFLENGGRIEKPENCPEEFYDVMKECWSADPEDRIEFSDIRMKLATQLEDLTEDYSYLKLNADMDYYNVQYGEKNKQDVIIIPDGESKIEDRRQSEIEFKCDPEKSENI